MSYNPTRADSSNRTIQSRGTPPQGAGVTRTSIMQKQANGQHRVPAGEKILTPFGHSIVLFECAEFISRFETMHARTATGRGVTADGDRSLFVIRGAMFVAIKNEKGLIDTFKVIDGQHLNLPRGTEYELATSGDFGVDFHVTETVNYRAGWQALTIPTVGAQSPVALDMLQSAPTVVRRGVNPQTMMQAQDIAVQSGERRRRAATRAAAGEFATNANSPNTIGVSPMPSGPPREE